MRIALASCLGFLIKAGPAAATSISVGQFSAHAYDALLTGMGDAIVVEDFEAFSEGNVGGNGAPLQTQVGTFETLGGAGTGGTIRRPDNTFTGRHGANPNDPSQLAVRDGYVFGRVSTTAILTGNSADDKFLDSNDSHGIIWNIDLGGMLFDKVLLTLTDAADSGATVTITSDLGSFVQFAAQPSSSQKTVFIDFGAAIARATVQFANLDGPDGPLRTNDGLGLDDIALHAVPVPNTVALLAASVAVLAGLQRRRKNKQPLDALYRS